MWDSELVQAPPVPGCGRRCSMSTIKVFDVSGRAHLISPKNIVRISEAATSSQWHGIRSFVKMTDGVTLECGDTVKEIEERLEQEEKNKVALLRDALHTTYVNSIGFADYEETKAKALDALAKTAGDAA